MNKYNGLLSSVSHKYHIYKGTQETENDWKTRLIYSISSQHIRSRKMLSVLIYQI